LFLSRAHKGPNKIQEVIFISGAKRWKEAKSFQSADNSLYFKANDDNLDANDNGNLGNANDNYSGGLFFFRLSLRNKGAHSELPLTN